jgi:hypothetical protein
MSRLVCVVALLACGLAMASARPLRQQRFSSAHTTASLHPAASQERATTFLSHEETVHGSLGMAQRSHLAPSIMHEHEILLPSHLGHEGEHEVIYGASARRELHPEPFTPQSWPYTPQDGPCTTYARQDNCVGNPPISPQPLPSCGRFSGPAANTSVWGIIGDFGLDGLCEQQVHALVMKLQSQFGTLDFLMTLGDNAYWSGSCASLESSVRQYYSSFLPNNGSAPCTDPMKSHSRGYVNPHWVDSTLHMEEEERLKAVKEQVDGRIAHAQEHGVDPVRFYPAMGNHDWSTYHADPVHMPYFQFFPYLLDIDQSNDGKGQFYKTSPLPGVELYSLNSNLGDPSASPTEQDLFQDMVTWLKGSLMNSTAAFKLVYFHHPPFCTAQHDPLSPWMDLDYEDWGASAVFAGHEHVYERMLLNRPTANGQSPTMPYVVNGLGGHPWTYTIDGCPAYPGSQFRYNAYHGAQLVIQSWDESLQREKLDLCFYSLENGGSLIDQFEIVASN